MNQQLIDTVIAKLLEERSKDPSLRQVLRPWEQLPEDYKGQTLGSALSLNRNLCSSGTFAIFPPVTVSETLEDIQRRYPSSIPIDITETGIGPFYEIACNNIKPHSRRAGYLAFDPPYVLFNFEEMVFQAYLRLHEHSKTSNGELSHEDKEKVFNPKRDDCYNILIQRIIDPQQRGEFPKSGLIMVMSSLEHHVLTTQLWSPYVGCGLIRGREDYQPLTSLI